MVPQEAQSLSRAECTRSTNQPEPKGKGRSVEGLICPTVTLTNKVTMEGNRHWAILNVYVRLPQMSKSGMATHRVKRPNQLSYTQPPEKSSSSGSDNLPGGQVCRTFWSLRSKCSITTCDLWYSMIFLWYIYSDIFGALSQLSISYWPNRSFTLQKPYALCLRTPCRWMFLWGLTTPPLVASSKRVSSTWITGGLFTGWTTKPLQVGTRTGDSSSNVPRFIHWTNPSKITIYFGVQATDFAPGPLVGVQHGDTEFQVHHAMIKRRKGREVQGLQSASEAWRRVDCLLENVWQKGSDICSCTSENHRKSLLLHTFWSKQSSK